jgi:uncharacterized protein (TIGR02466 family)
MPDPNQAELIELFPSPLLRFYWADSGPLNKELKELILFKEGREAGINTTNVGGWHSKKELQTWEGHCILLLMSRIMATGAELTKRFFASENRNLLDGWTVEAWANVSRRGNYNKYHHHIRNNNLWSGVYYIDNGLTVEDTCSPAKIVFVDRHRPEPRGDDKFKCRFAVEPQPGLMLVFPSSLGHRVEPHLGSAERLTIAFNLKNANFTTVNYEIVAHGARSKKGMTLLMTRKVVPLPKTWLRPTLHSRYCNPPWLPQATTLHPACRRNSVQNRAFLGKR